MAIVVINPKASKSRITPLPPGGKEFQNHQHKCELEMINGKYAKCPYKIKRKNMSHDDKCDECNHLRIVNLNDDGDVITGII